MRVIFDFNVVYWHSREDKQYEYLQVYLLRARRPFRKGEVVHGGVLWNL